MKKINLPKVLFITWFVILFAGIVGFTLYPDLVAALFFALPVFLPVSLLVLIIHKLITPRLKNPFFIVTILLYMILYGVVYSVWLNAFDNLFW